MTISASLGLRPTVTRPFGRQLLPSAFVFDSIYSIISVRLLTCKVHPLLIDASPSPDDVVRCEARNIPNNDREP